MTIRVVNERIKPPTDHVLSVLRQNIAELKCHLAPNRIAIHIDGAKSPCDEQNARSSRAAARFCELSTTLRSSRIWLDYNGYRVVTKPTKEFIDASGRFKVKGNMNIELTVNAMDWLRTLTR